MQEEMKCPNCGGMCEFTEFDGLRKVYFKRKCEVCNGTGQVVQTNFENITSSPERLAEFLDRISDFCEICENHCDNDTGMQCNGDFKGHWVEWLKQPHTSKE